MLLLVLLFTVGVVPGKTEDPQSIRVEHYAQLDAWLNSRLDGAAKTRAAYWKLDFSPRGEL